MTFAFAGIVGVRFDQALETVHLKKFIVKTFQPIPTLYANAFSLYLSFLSVRIIRIWNYESLFFQVLCLLAFFIFNFSKNIQLQDRGARTAPVDLPFLDLNNWFKFS